ncbi:MAG: hypothetical protein II413_07630, partial [Treponema sp.]|nr:hypothetical protein [Treponema sp.]
TTANTINIEEIFFIMKFIALRKRFFKGVPLDPTLGGIFIQARQGLEGRAEARCQRQWSG